MTAHVNLLPQRRRHQRHRLGRMRLWIAIDLVAASLAVAAIGLTLAMRPATTATRAAVDALEKQIADARAQLDQIAPLVIRDRKTLEAVRHVSDQPDWSILLTLLGRLRDDHAVLRSVRLEPVAGEGGAIVAAALSAQDRRGGVSENFHRPAAFMVRLEGLAESQADVSRIVLACERAGLFDVVKLVNTARQGFMGRDTTRFELECRIGRTNAKP